MSRLALENATQKSNAAPNILPIVRAAFAFSGCE